MAVVETISKYRWVILGIAFLAQFSNALASQVLPPLAPLFQPELGLTKAQVGLFSTALFSGAWAVLIVAGVLTDRFGARKVMALGQVLCGGLLLGIGISDTFVQALAVMFAVGLGRGAVAPGVTTAIVDWFPPRSRGTAMGIKQAAVPIAGVIVSAAIPALGLLIGWRYAVTAVSIWIIAAGVVTGFLYRDRAGSGPVRQKGKGPLDGFRELAKNRQLWLVSVTAILFAAAQIAVVTYLALYFAEVVLVREIPEESTRIVAAGGYLAICQTGGVAGRILWGILSDRVFHGRRMIVLAIMGGVAALSCIATAVLSSGAPLWLLTVLIFVLGASAIGWAGLYLSAAVETAGKKFAGSGVGFSMTLMQGGNVIGAPLFGYIVDVSQSYSAAWFFLGGVMLVATAMSAAAARGERQIN